MRLVNGQGQKQRLFILNNQNVTTRFLGKWVEGPEVWGSATKTLPLLRESKGAFRLPRSWISMKTDVIFPYP